MGSALQSVLRVASLSGISGRGDIQAVILAAGRGSRLGRAIDEQAKCMADIDGRRLIEYQLDLLNAAGIHKVAVVTGYKAEQVREAVAARADLFHNAAWAATEGMYSLSLCRDWVKGPLLVINCDVLLDPDGLERLLQSEGNALVFDSSSGADAEQMAVEFEGDCLTCMSKNLPLNRTHGENIGLLYFDRRAALLLFREAEALLKMGATQARLTSAVQRIARYIPFRGIDLAGMAWIEIDFPDDLLAARQRIWPAIEAKWLSYLATVDACA
jgi:choline kinase